MITGAHAIIYSTDPAADRALLHDLIGLSHVDVGGGWLILALPPSELAVHPSEKNGRHELYLMCDDIEVFRNEMSSKHVACSEIREERWGRLVEIALPGGGHLGVYQPLHARPESM